MNNNKRLPWSFLAIVLLPGTTLAVGLDYLDYNATLPYPAIEVTGQGNEFKQASNAPISFLGQARGKCKRGYRVTYFSHTVDPNGTNTGQVYASNRLVDNPGATNMTWSSSWKALGTDWAPNSSWRNAAVNACNKRLEERLAQGESYQQIRGQDFDVVIQRDLWSGVHMACWDYGIGAATHHEFRKHPVVARCMAGTLAEPTPTVPTAGTLGQAFSLAHVSLQSPRPNYQGVCPGEIPFTATVHNNGAGGRLQYRFIVDGKPAGGFQEVQVPAGNKAFQIPYTVAATATPKPQPQQPQGLQKQGQGPQPLGGLQVAPDHELRIEVKTNRQNLSAEADYAVTCKTLQATVITPTPKGQPDITALPPVAIGTQIAQWADEIVLTDQDASATTPRGCQYRFAYTAVNAGAADAGPSVGRLRDGQGVTLHQQPGMAMAAGAQRKVNGMLTLAPGQHLLGLGLDDDQKVAESNEGNNVFRLSVMVPESCGGGGGAQRPEPRQVPRPAPRPRPQ
ncbi:CARDB domain-containing protein [Thioalkalivibrio sp. XN8]|uniref:CARDB domain-containing protein n=1 Tax=Thioalkalivibrio sp. XN8 TaxID=2712863 RepID=UPI0013EA984D|nr:CARDB domain-containing protein [Thioalkalivibrio sp. XN8]NGP54472.1 hypothetical protein [Thioalkalivibrio sp. XN8]